MPTGHLATKCCASQPAGVYDIVLAGDGTGFVGCQEQHHTSDIVTVQAPLQALRFHQPGIALVVEPEIPLALSEYPAGRDGVHANIVGTEIASERAGKAKYCGLAGGVGNHTALADHPR